MIFALQRLGLSKKTRVVLFALQRLGLSKKKNRAVLVHCKDEVFYILEQYLLHCIDYIFIFGIEIYF